MPLPRLRTMKDVVAELKSEDPHFPVTYYNFRNLVLSGKIPSRRLGGPRSALLVNMDDVYKYYSSPMDCEDTVKVSVESEIHPIRE